MKITLQPGRCPSLLGLIFYPGFFQGVREVCPAPFAMHEFQQHPGMPPQPGPQRFAGRPPGAQPLRQCGNFFLGPDTLACHHQQLRSYLWAEFCCSDSEYQDVVLNL